MTDPLVVTAVFALVILVLLAVALAAIPLLTLHPPRPEPVFTLAPQLPESSREERLAELVDVLRARFRDCESTTDPREEEETVEILGLFVCVRQVQARSETEITDELVSIGLVQDYAVDLVASLEAASRVRLGEPVRAVKYGAGLPALWVNPTHRRRQRNAMRASLRLQTARELAGMEDVPVELSESAQIEPPAVEPRFGLRDTLRTTFAVAIGIAVLGAVALLLHYWN